MSLSIQDLKPHNRLLRNKMIQAMVIKPVNTLELSKENPTKTQMATPIIMMHWIPKLKQSTQLLRNTESNKLTSKKSTINGEVEVPQTQVQL
jgi:hypothetical protein